MSVYLPGSGWVDVDPDQRRASRHRPRDAGWGRDYGDVTPVKGIALGGGHQLVDVEVRVEPIEAAHV